MTVKNLTTGMLALIIAAGLVAAGCGGDDDDGDPGASITKEEWIAQANEICQEGDEEMERAAQEAFADAQDGGRPDAQAEQRFLEEVVAPGIEMQVADIAALPRPEGDEDQIEGIIAAAEEGAATVKANPSALEEEPDPFKEATQLIVEYGVTDCG